MIDGDTFPLHPRLRSLNLPIARPRTLEATNLPSLAEWKQHMNRRSFPVAAMLSLLGGGGVLPRSLPAASYFKQYPHSSGFLCFQGGLKNTTLMDDCIFHGTTPSRGITTV